MAEAKFNRVCVFCGASSGSKPEYLESARALGLELAKQGTTLVYGGGTVGLMGELAKTVYSAKGGKGVIGVIPEALKPREVSGEMIGEMHIVQDMHTRKAMMARLSDAFIAMPGGFGTLEELMEVITWQQLGFHSKPIGLLNIQGFFDPLISFFDHCVTEGFVRSTHNRVLVSTDPADLLKRMSAFRASPSLIEHAMSVAAVGEDVSSTDATS